MESVSSHFEEDETHDDDAITEPREALRRLDEHVVNAKNACIETEQLVDQTHDEHERGFLVYRLQKQRLKYAKYHLRKLELLKTQATSGILSVSGGTVVARSSKEAPLRLLGSGAYKELEELLKTRASDGSHSHTDGLAEFRRKFVEHGFSGTELSNADVATPRKLRRSIRASKGTAEHCDTLDHARRFLTDSLARGIFIGRDPLDLDEETNATSTVREVLLLGHGAEGHSVDAILERQEYIKEVRQITDEHIKFVHEHNHRFRLETVLNIAADTCTTTEHHQSGGASETLRKHMYHEAAALSGRSSSTSSTESDSSSDDDTNNLRFEASRRRGEGKGSADHHHRHHHHHLHDQHHHANADVRHLRREGDLDVFEVDKDVKELHEDVAKHVTVEVEETTHRTRRKLKGEEQDETSRKSSSSSSSCEHELDDRQHHHRHDEHRHVKAVEHEVQLFQPFPELPEHPIHAVPTDEKTLLEDVHRTIYLDVEETTHRSRSPRRRSAEPVHEEIPLTLQDLHYSQELDRVHFHVDRIVSEELDSLDRSTTISLDETDDVFLSCDEATPELWRDERTPEPVDEHTHTDYWTPEPSDEEASHRTPVTSPAHDHLHPFYRHHPHKDFLEEMLDVNLRLTCHLLYRTLDIPEIPYRHYRPRYSHVHDSPSPTEEPHHVHIDIHLAEPRSVGAQWREADAFSFGDVEMPHRKHHSTISIVEEPILTYASSYRPPTPVIDVRLADDLTRAFELPPIPLSYVLEVAVGSHTSVTVDTTYCIDEEIIEHTHHVRAPLERHLSHSSSEETTSTVIELNELVPYQTLPWSPFELVVHTHATLVSPDFEVQEQSMRFSPEEPLYYEIANTESRQSYYTDVEDHEDHAQRILLDNAINETQERTEDVHIYDVVPHGEVHDEHHYDEVPYEATALRDLHRWNEMDRHPLECRPPVEIYLEIVEKQRVHAMQDLVRTEDVPFMALTVRPIYETSYELEAKLLQEVLQGHGAERHPSEPLEPRKHSDSERTRSKTIPEALRSAIKSAIHPLVPHRHRHEEHSHTEEPLRELRRTSELSQLSLLISPELPDFGKRISYHVPVVDVERVEDDHQRHVYSDDSFDDDHEHVYDVVHHETEHLSKTGELERFEVTIERHEPIYDTVPFEEGHHHGHHHHQHTHYHDYDIVPPEEPIYDVPEDKEPASFEPEEVVHSISPEADMEHTPLHVHVEPLPVVIVHERHEEVADNERIVEDLQKSADVLDGIHYEEHQHELVAQDLKFLPPLQDISPARELPLEPFIIIFPEVLHESDLETFTSEENIYASIPDEDVYAVPRDYTDIHQHEDVEYEEPYEPHYDYPPEEHHYYSPPEWHMEYELYRVKELDEHADRREQWYHRDEVLHIHLDIQYADVEVAHEPLYHFSLPPLWREELPVCENVYPVDIFNGLHEMVTISDFRNISGLPHELELRFSRMRRTSDARIVSEQLQTSSEDSALLYRSRRSAHELTLLQRLFRHRKLPDYIPSSPVLLCNASEVHLASPLSLYFHLLNYYIHRNHWEVPYFLTTKDRELRVQQWPERLHHAPNNIREATESMLRASEGNRITVGILLRNKNLKRPSSAPVGDNRIFSPRTEAEFELARSHSEEDLFLFDDEHVARIHEHCDWTDGAGETRRRKFDEPCSTDFSEEELWRHIYDTYEKVEIPQELSEAEERLLLRKTTKWHAHSEEHKHKLKYVVVRTGHDDPAVPPLPTSPIPEIPKLDEYERRFSWDNELSSPGARYVVQAKKFIPPKSPTESPVHSPTRHGYVEKVHRTSGALHIERLTPASDTPVLRSSDHKDTVKEVIPVGSHSHAFHRSSEAVHATNVSAVAEATYRTSKLSEAGKVHRTTEAQQHVEKVHPIFEVPGRASVFADTDKGVTPTSPPAQGPVPTLSAMDVKLSPFGKRKLIPGLKEYKKYGLELSDDEEFVIPGDGRVSTEPQPKHTKLDTTVNRRREEPAPPKSKHWTSRAASGEEQRLTHDTSSPVSKRASVTERKVFSPPPAAEDFRFSAAFQRIHKSAEERFTEKDVPKEDKGVPVEVEHHDQVVPNLRHVEPSERTQKPETTHEFPVKPRLRHVDRKRRTTEELGPERASAKLARVSAELQADDEARKAVAFKFITRFAEPPSLFKAVRHYSRMPDLQDGFPVDHLVDGMLNGGEENDASRKWDPTSLLEELYKIDYNPLVEKRNRFRSMEGHVEVPNDEEITAPGIEKEWKKQYFRVRDARLQWFATHGADEHPAGDVLLTGTTVTANRAEWSIEVKGGKENADIHMRTPSNVFDKWYQAIMSHSHASLIDAYVQPAPPPVPHYTQRVVLIELGSSSIRAGVLTNKPSLPQVFFPSVGCVTETGEVFVGIDALKPEIRHLGNLQRPIDATDSSVERYRLNRPVLTGCIHKVLADLRINPSQYKVLLSIPQNIPTTFIGDLMRVLLNENGFQAASIARQPSLILYSYDVTTGVVVDIGERLNIVPVIDEYIVESAIVSLPFGAQQIRDNLRQKLNGRNNAVSAFRTPVEQVVLRYLAEQTGYVATDYDEESRTAVSSEKTVDLSKYHIGPGMDANFTIDSSRFHATEGLFKPKKWGHEVKGVHQLIYDAIQLCPIDSRRTLYRNIYLSGGTSLLPGFAERLEVELSNLAPNSMFVQVHGSPWRYHAAYLGSHIVTNSYQFEKCCADKSNLDEYVRQVESSLS